MEEFSIRMFPTLSVKTLMGYEFGFFMGYGLGLLMGYEFGKL